MPAITDFKNALLSGGARSNQFRVELTFPGIVAVGALAGQSAQFLCKAATIPASFITDIQVPYRGRVIHAAGDREFQPWTITVINDSSFLLRNAFEEWMHKINNNQRTLGETFPSTYQADLAVHQLDKNDAILKSYQIVDAYPTQLSDINVSFDQANHIEEFQVTFVYNYWTATTTA